MGYIITSNGYSPGYCLARSYIGDFKSRDFIAPLSRVFGSRIVPSQPLVFDTVEQAKTYLNKHYGVIPDNWKITKYNSCMNCIENEVYENDKI